MEEFFLDKAMTVESLLSDVKRTLNISKTLWPTLEIPTKFLHLNQFENSPMMKHLFVTFDVVGGLHVISLAFLLYLIYFSIYSIIMALCKTCDMPNCLHCAHCSPCHKYIKSPNDSHAILTSNSLRNQHQLLVLPVCLLLYHFLI